MEASVLYFFKDPDYMEFDILKIFLYADNYLDYKYHDIFKHHILRSIEYFFNERPML